MSHQDKHYKIKIDKIVKAGSWIMVSSLLSVLLSCNDLSAKASENKPASKDTQEINATASEGAQVIVATDNA